MGALGSLLVDLGSLLGDLEAVLDCSWSLLDCSEGLLDRSWVVLRGQEGQKGSGPGSQCGHGKTLPPPPLAGNTEIQKGKKGL